MDDYDFAVQMWPDGGYLCLNYRPGELFTDSSRSHI